MICPECFGFNCNYNYSDTPFDVFKCEDCEAYINENNAIVKCPDCGCNKITMLIVGSEISVKIDNVNSSETRDKITKMQKPVLICANRKCQLTFGG